MPLPSPYMKWNVCFPYYEYFDRYGQCSGKQYALQEVDAFGRDRLPQNSDLEKLPYVQAAFKEALRLFPPGHISIRVAVEDLNLNGLSVKKGTWVHVSSTYSFFLHGLSMVFRGTVANCGVFGLA